MRASRTQICSWTLGITLLAAGAAARAEGEPASTPPSSRPESTNPAPSPATPAPAASTAQPAPAPRLRDETTELAFTDNHGRHVQVRVPVSLNRPANHFRLYGTRPLTLWDQDRRRDLYRDAFLEVATRARLAPGVNAWAPLLKQLDWLGSHANSALFGSTAPGGFPSAAPADPTKQIQELAKQAMQTATSPNVAAVTAALGSAAGVDTLPEIAQPVAATLELRALATDTALRRLELAGRALHLEAPGTDPALREGYRLARADFEDVRQGLWPALAATLRKNQGQLVLSSVKQVVLSRIGFWAIFGYMGWQGVESALNVEYHGQYCICLATLGDQLGTAVLPAAQLDNGSPAALALYSEYVLNYELTEALKSTGVMPLQPAGGRSTGEWQIRFSNRCDELKKFVAAS